MLTEAALVTTSGYCSFGCAICVYYVYFRLWLQYGDWYGGHGWVDLYSEQGTGRCGVAIDG